MVRSISVLIVDDSAFMRKIITDLVEEDPQLKVVGTARNGREALQKMEQLKPDVCTLDVEMPVMDGLTTLQEMKHRKFIPVIMLSSTTKHGAENTMIALERGAVDFVAKPSGSISLDLHKVRAELVQKIKTAYESSQTRTHIRYEPQLQIQKTGPQCNTPSGSEPVIHVSHQQQDQQGRNASSRKTKKLILIGCSTGGPKALSYLFTRIKYERHTAFLVVQHMPPAFTHSLAIRLNQISPYEVKEGGNGEIVEGGHIYVAPGGYHMGLKSMGLTNVIHLHQENRPGLHRPSVDALFESAATVRGDELMTLTLTGMGKDGQCGLKYLNQQGQAYNIAEHASTCVVNGMPQAAIETGYIDEIAPLSEIPALVERFMEL